MSRQPSQPVLIPETVFSTVGGNTLHEKAVKLAENLRIPLLAEPQAWAETTDGNRLLLRLGENGLSLAVVGEKSGPLRVNFVGAKNAFRLAVNRTVKQPLARAVGIGHGQRPSIFDATAGFGGDAFVFASLGCQVTMAERSPIIAALLADGLSRAACHSGTAEIAAAMRLIPGDAKGILSTLAPVPDCVYLDPMYPPGKNSARHKKEMRLLRQLIGDDEDSAALLSIAREVAMKRVVVKRPKGAPRLANAQPSHVITMPNSRFDVYLRPHV
ncbi:MAG TPA: rRNA methyltransferase [Desulfobulbaceae bacterium]|nr:rRNA methyltransferase [Desulfobulbaceae bacterium]